MPAVESDPVMERAPHHPQKVVRSDAALRCAGLEVMAWEEMRTELSPSLFTKHRFGD